MTTLPYKDLKFTKSKTNRLILSDFSTLWKLKIKMGAVVQNEEAFCLKWNDFHTSLTSTFTELRAESDLLDATIICEGKYEDIDS